MKLDCIFPTECRSNCDTAPWFTTLTSLSGFGLGYFKCFLPAECSCNFDTECMTFHSVQQLRGSQISHQWARQSHPAGGKCTYHVFLLKATWCCHVALSHVSSSGVAQKPYWRGEGGSTNGQQTTRWTDTHHSVPTCTHAPLTEARHNS